MEAILEVKDLCKIIKKREILKNVSFSIQPGEIVGLVGPNGAGKTTTIKCCCGLSSFKAGSVVIDGHSIKEDFEKAVENMALAVDGDSFYNNLTAEENILCAYPCKKITKEMMESTLKLVGLDARKDSLVKTYSLGMKQRLNLALALINSPKLVFLDEPFNGVDPSGVADFRRIIVDLARNKGTAFVIATHNLSELQKLADRVVFIDHGQILKDENIIQGNSNVCFVFENEEEAKRILNEGYKYYYKDGKFYVSVEKDKLNGLLAAITINQVGIKDMSMESFIETEYLEIMGDSKID